MGLWLALPVHGFISSIMRIWPGIESAFADVPTCRVGSCKQAVSSALPKAGLLDKQQRGMAQCLIRCLKLRSVQESGLIGLRSAPIAIPENNIPTPDSSWGVKVGL